ncbi:hypothetical protein XBKB1_910005 [Xenorhabdus bovienii str. kraussei Becker Underwood]|uniref:Uncharacterized protein n=1 Tax=Xenorhabdus bovienii str. kraussei Becker Underwood TaxID=1398204 RepID=A0A077PR25_XENBV|nr:hypothetical protein XBKB1_910005 [Xenorhabdus bovienii str. kraussei Becker Underwood]
MASCSARLLSQNTICFAKRRDLALSFLGGAAFLVVGFTLIGTEPFPLLSVPLRARTG